MASPAALEILAAEGLATVQDLGRPALGHLGIAESGACDRGRHATAQRLCSNDAEAAGLELQGARLVWRLHGEPRLAAVVGDCAWTVDGQPWSPWRSVWVNPGQVVAVAPVGTGLRAYLAVAGGIAVARVGNSASTHVFAGLGGWQGRGLRPGDVVPLDHARQGCRELAILQLELRSAEPLLAIWTPAARLISTSARRHLASATWKVGAQSDRTAIALMGPPLPVRATLRELSQPTVCGSIQVAGDGTPRILLRDRPTIGGFPQPAVVVSASHDDAAQLRPGDTVRLQFVSQARARQALLESVQRQKAIVRSLSPAWPPSSRQLLELL